jgi:hypothetical protein
MSKEIKKSTLDNLGVTLDENNTCTWCDKEIQEGELYEVDANGDKIHFNCACEIEDINDINNS